jgi:branched-subunit amino acid aminotransferase/4-amino-4-deoxychorismate lyase
MSLLIHVSLKMVLILWEYLGTGEKELVTAPATSEGVVLSGITRDSIIQLVKQLPGWRVTERYV